MSLEVCRLPHPILFTPTAEVDPASVRSLALEMVDMMVATPACVGIAAPQVGHAVRLFVLDTSGHKKARSANGLVVMVNPVVVSRAGAEVAREGCLSVPDLTGDVARSTEMTVRGVDPRDGSEVTVEADAFEARALQHELDHLDGLLFLDRVRTPRALHGRKRYR